MEDHTFVMTLQPKELPPAPMPPGVQEHIQKELNWVERYLDLTKQYSNQPHNYCQGSEGPWRTMVLRDGSRVAERMSIHPSAYKTSHDVTPVEQVEEGVALTDALYWWTQG